jgi:hypothetical protein
VGTSQSLSFFLRPQLNSRASTVTLIISSMTRCVRRSVTWVDADLK